MHVCCDTVVHVFAVSNDPYGLGKRNGVKRLDTDSWFRPIIGLHGTV